MRYYVTYRIDARYVAEVEADSIEQAMQEATLEYYDADFGIASDIDAEMVIIEDQDGRFVWEKA